ncbi:MULTISPECIES: VOC family protein [Brevibacterium]|jgi:predicted lactoylglutathione lyase|uniref:Glyoxalase n=1 Tax=Brevibacterium sediminis TaxID=1857024 RepID=A0ABQ1MT91_9MICO|nr:MULTISPECIES: VOC family protein [Brevibacterium]GGC46176.1 glyoxalase [Brevibacterium sediminis]
MKPLTTILSLPVADPQATANFYADGLGLETDGVEDGIVAFELPNLSIFFITADEYGQYLELSGQPGSKNPVPGASIISCAFATRAEIDEVLDRAVAAGGSADPGQDVDGSYMGYFADLDGYIWELVANEQTAKAATAAE